MYDRDLAIELLTQIARSCSLFIYSSGSSIL